MTTQIVRVGDTLSVEIPEELVVRAALPVGEPVEWVTTGDGGIALVRSSRQSPTIHPPRLTLEELMGGLEERDSLGEYDWGQPRGAEVW